MISPNSVKLNAGIQPKSLKPLSRKGAGKTQEVKSPKDGITDDMRAMLDDMRSPKSETTLGVTAEWKVALKQEKANPSLAEPKAETLETRSRPEVKEPKSQGMREMLESMQNPASSPRLMVDDKGLIVFGEVEEREMPGWQEQQKMALPKAQAKSESRPTSGAEVLNRLKELSAKKGVVPLSAATALAVGAAGVVAMGAVAMPIMGGVAGAVTGAALGLGGNVSQLFSGGQLPGRSGRVSAGDSLKVFGGRGNDVIRQAGGSGSDKVIARGGSGSDTNVSTPKKPREGSAKAEMLDNINNPKQETALGVDNQGRIAMLQEPFKG